MKLSIRMLAPLVFALLLPAAAVLADDMHEHAAKASSPALDRLKKLEGEWTGKAGPGDHQMDATVVYRVTASGSAVMETLFPGTPMEMVTMYTADGNQLALTHYCASGNQPRMKARKASAPNEIVFDFAGGTGFDPKTDKHMHAAKLIFVDDNHLRSEWTDFDKGKQGEVMVFELARKM